MLLGLGFGTIVCKSCPESQNVRKHSERSVAGKHVPSVHVPSIIKDPNPKRSFLDIQKPPINTPWRVLALFSLFFSFGNCGTKDLIPEDFSHQHLKASKIRGSSLQLRTDTGKMVTCQCEAWLG